MRMFTLEQYFDLNAIPFDLGWQFASLFSAISFFMQCLLHVFVCFFWGVWRRTINKCHTGKKMELTTQAKWNRVFDQRISTLPIHVNCWRMKSRQTCDFYFILDNFFLFKFYSFCLLSMLEARLLFATQYHNHCSCIVVYVVTMTCKSCDTFWQIYHHWDMAKKKNTCLIIRYK